MKVKVIKQEIPEEISEQGGASIRLVDKETVELETSIDEAKDQLCVVGDKLLVKGQFVGLFKSMVKGIERDGNARQLGDFLTLYPVPTGEFDLDKGWDPAVNGVRIRARLMNEMEIDISKWEFEDVTPGRQSFKLESVRAGATDGVVENYKAVEINGKNLPLTNDIRVDWALEDGSAHGTIAASKVTSTVTRVDITADALGEVITQANNGKKMIFTVRGNYANAKISATLKYVALPPPTITKIASEGSTGVVKTQPFSIEGTNLGYSTGDSVKIDWMSGTIAMSETVTPTAISATKLTFATVSKFNDTPDDIELTFTVKINGMTVVKKTMLLGTE